MKHCEKIIDVTALKHNLQYLKKIGQGRFMLAMLKANAYGHGLASVGHVLKHQADAFGVATLDEAFVLRREGIDTPIYLMQGVQDAQQIQAVAENNITLIVIHLEQLKLCCEQSLPLNIWLKINTGMHRSGIHEEDFEAAIDLLKKAKQMTCQGIMTHFASSDDLQSSQTDEQGQAFQSAFAYFQTQLGFHLKTSLSNSAAIFSHPKWHGDVLRPGIALYGASPFENRTGAELGLKPVMCLRSYLIAIYDVNPGDRIGYGATYVVETPTKIGIARVGYGDGYPRACNHGTPVLVNGKQCALAGRVSMDILTINLKNCMNASIGDEVILWGDRLPVERIAKAASTIPHEVLTCVRTRPREILQS